MVILGIDAAQCRVRHGDGAAHTHIAISLPQPVHGYVDLFPRAPTPIVIKKRRLYTNSRIYQIGATHTDAAYRRYPLIAATEQVERHFCDLRTGAGGNCQFLLPAVPMQLRISDSNFDHRTL